jgi:hypothetical protein
MGIIITLSTTVVGATAPVDAQELESSSKKDIDTIVESLASALGISSIGAICSSISIQQKKGLVQLKYPESCAFGIVEINVARCSAVSHLDSSEAWKAYDFRTKIVVFSEMDSIYTQAIKMIQLAVQRLSELKIARRQYFGRGITIHRYMRIGNGEIDLQRVRQIR